MITGSYYRPDVDDFKEFFVRDFPYGTNIATSITDGDIERALLEAGIVINEELFCEQSEFTLGYEYLSAHNLAMNIRESSQGLSSRFDWGTTSKSVGSVSVGSVIPNFISENPQYAYYAQTSYGMKYLMLVLPKLVGRIGIAGGGTTA